jgi:hypothetical protein
VIGSYIHAKLLDYPPFAGRPLPDNRPRQYRRKITREELVAQEQGTTPADAVGTGSAAGTAVVIATNAAPNGAAGTSSVPAAPPAISTEAQG